VEDLQTYTCEAEGCNVEVKLARVQGGLLLYKKEDPNNPGQPYTHINHELPPKPTKKTTEYSLSVKQKEEILMRRGNETISNIVHDMVQSTKVPTTDAQSTDVHQFTLAAQGFARRKGKYFMHEYNHQPFTINQTSEILNELMQDAPKQKWSSLNEFMSTSLFKTMTERVKVLEHNFQSDGVKDVVFFESKQAAEVVRLAGLMFEGENKGAIQFSCDFTHIPGTDFVLGICGVDDFKHRFWPTSFIVCPTESGEMAKKVMGRMVELINLDVNGVPDKVLIDGANALHSACIELGIDPRSCFTHIIRMPLSRGGGKVGSKGSFANYLIKTMKVSHSNTAKIVGDAMLANYIPPMHKEDFEAFIDLMRDRHHDKLETKQEKNEAQREHVNKTYLSYDPLRLGGRGAGIPGQSGSNNGGEIRGGNIKNKWRHVTKKCSKVAKKSVVYIVGAVAMDLMMCPNLNDTKKGFAYKPVRDESDYGLLRRISKFNLDGDDNALLPHDIQYMICTEYGSHTADVNPHEVIGNGNVSCSFQLPTASRVLTSLRQMEESTNIMADSWLENSVVDVTSTTNSYQKCNISKEKKRRLKMDLLHNLFANVPGRKNGESFRSFVNRRLQRNPSVKTTSKTATRVKNKKARKEKKTVRTPLDIQREKDKHGNEADKSSDKKEKKKRAGKKENIEEYLYWTDEFEEAEILDLLSKEGFKDLDADETLQSIAEEKERVGPPRQLGDWIQVDCDHVNKRVTCCCEDYNFDGMCFHVATFEVLQFGKLPDGDCEFENEHWGEIRKKCIKVLKKQYSRASKLSGILRPNSYVGSVW